MVDIFEQIRDSKWDGKAFRVALEAGELPEYHGGELTSIFEHEAGECPHHMESLLDHVSGVIHYAVELARGNELGRYDRITLVTAATWHDVGKMVTRAWKARYVCPVCGRSHHSMPAACRTNGCPGVPEEREVVGYHEHQSAGASIWMWGNIADRLGVREPMRSHVHRLIACHSDAHERMMSGRFVGDPVAVLLSWADELGKVNAQYVGDRTDPFPRAYERSRRMVNHGRYSAAEGPSGDPAGQSGDHGDGRPGRRWDRG